MPSPEVRARAVGALAGERRLRPAIVKALVDLDAQVVDAARNAIVDILRTEGFRNNFV